MMNNFACCKKKEKDFDGFDAKINKLEILTIKKMHAKIC